MGTCPAGCRLILHPRHLTGQAALARTAGRLHPPGAKRASWAASRAANSAPRRTAPPPSIPALTSVRSGDIRASRSSTRAASASPLGAADLACQDQAAGVDHGHHGGGSERETVGERPEEGVGVRIVGTQRGPDSERGRGVLFLCPLHRGAPWLDAVVGRQLADGGRAHQGVESPSQLTDEGTPEVPGTGRNPISPAPPEAPRRSFPSSMTAAPMPWPSQSRTKVSRSWAAPMRCSATAARLVSFSTRTVASRRCWSSLTSPRARRGAPRCS